MYIIIHHVITGRPGGMLSRRRFTDSRGGGITRGQNKGGLGPSTSEICPPPPRGLKHLPQPTMPLRPLPRRPRGDSHICHFPHCPYSLRPATLRYSHIRRSALHSVEHRLGGHVRHCPLKE